MRQNNSTYRCLGTESNRKMENSHEKHIHKQPGGKDNDTSGRCVEMLSLGHDNNQFYLS